MLGCLYVSSISLSNCVFVVANQCTKADLYRKCIFNPVGGETRIEKSTRKRVQALVFAKLTKEAGSILRFSDALV